MKVKEIKEINWIKQAGVKGMYRMPPHDPKREDHFTKEQ